LGIAISETPAGVTDPAGHSPISESLSMALPSRGAERSSAQPAASAPLRALAVPLDLPRLDLLHE
jgi:hypothetical protein